jgi:hypothetical protein
MKRFLSAAIAALAILIGIGSGVAQTQTQTGAALPDILILKGTWKGTTGRGKGSQRSCGHPWRGWLRHVCRINAERNDIRREDFGGREGILDGRLPPG